MYRVLLLLLFSVFYLCYCNEPAEKPGEEQVKKWMDREINLLLGQLSRLDSALSGHRPVAELQALFRTSRMMYKRTEPVVEYYFQGLTRRINGPALPDVKTEDGQVWPPHGFQVIEQFLYGAYHDSVAMSVSNEVRLLQTDLQFVKANLVHQPMLPRHAAELLQHQLIRIAALGISGFDSPIAALSITETASALEGMRLFGEIYYPADDWLPVMNEQFGAAIQYCRDSNDFTSFDRLAFIRQHLLPIGDYIAGLHREDDADKQLMKPIHGSFRDWMTGSGFRPDYYVQYAKGQTNAAKKKLGEQLFYDTRLSASGTLSCGTCHEPSRYFTDGKARALDLVHGGQLERNTPTLFYAALQGAQFHDLRSATLEDQADEVMRNSREFNLAGPAIARLLLSDSIYRKEFQAAFPDQDSIGAYEVRNAIAAYVRSLVPFNARFDRFMQGKGDTLSVVERNGFNLFMGKAKCGTCHFLPLFNGTVPPWYQKAESEIIGVPSAPGWENVRIDSDPGRFRINEMPELQYAFKTPTIRNVEMTAPYMHNGVYRTLDEVVEFYHRGGGAGLGINLPFQTLPFENLKLTPEEKQALVAFMKTLTDKIPVP